MNESGILEARVNNSMHKYIHISFTYGIRKIINRNHNINKWIAFAHWFLTFLLISLAYEKRYYPTLTENISNDFSVDFGLVSMTIWILLEFQIIKNNNQLNGCVFFFIIWFTQYRCSNNNSDVNIYRNFNNCTIWEKFTATTYNRYVKW